MSSVLKALFEPASIAVIGASRTPGKVGHSVLFNLIDAGYRGKIVPVNPSGGEILGLPAVAAIGELPAPLDLAVVCIPPKYVVDAVRELSTLPTRACIVITAGFKEVGREGWDHEQELKQVAQDAGMALLGPNCLGLINTHANLNATFAAGYPATGPIAFYSQSGALCVAILDWALGENIGFSKFVSLGNKALFNESDMLDYLVDDPKTNVILGYMEGVEDGRRFMEAAKRVTEHKPVVMIKSGTTSAGAKAASSHTGAIAGSDSAYGAAFLQSGVIRVKDVASLFNMAQAFSTQPLPQGPNLAVVTNSGGPGILAADAIMNSRLLMANLTNASIERMQGFLPSFAALYNPVDIIGDADAERYGKTLEVVIADPQVHAVLVLLSPTASVQIEGTAQAIIKASKDCGKPVFACFMGKERVEPGRRMLLDAGVPCYAFPEPAIASIEAMYRYQQWRSRPMSVEVCYRRDKSRAQRVIEQTRVSGCTEIVEFQAQEFLRAYELPIPDTRLCRTSREAVSAAKQIGYPVVLKIASPQISHKSDVDGVRVGLKTPEAVQAAFLDITSRAARLRENAVITGCLVQAMAPKGSKEVIVGFSRDPQFGPLIMFGLGGVYVEILKDISFRLAPLSLGDAADMVREIKTYPLLRGVRGERAVDFKAIEDVLLTMSQLAMDFPEIMEAEFNPVLVNPDGAVVADVRVTVCQD